MILLRVLSAMYSVVEALAYLAFFTIVILWLIAMATSPVWLTVLILTKVSCR